ncbi:MAG TPA: class I SAM-dependent methyltransferase [Bryobacteraceae bacterium]|nr:class I SAM-dependent methyltransferase [Bryobacteraceae bacterium]
MESAELLAILQEVRDRVRARHPQGMPAGNGASPGVPQIALPDLMPLLHARDRAMGKVAAIGTVNPRRGGIVNALVQSWKRMVARVLDWHVREQVDFNRKIVACIDSTLEALADANRALVTLGAELNGRIEVLAGRIGEEEKIGEELKDIRNHWAEWRFEWERKLQQNEMQFLRSVADLQGAFQHRADMMDATYRDALHAQHTDFEGALGRANMDIQQRLWADLERIRLEYERLIHSELRTIRQRAVIRPAAEAPAAPATEPRREAEHSLPFDYGRFAERFRGSEEYVKNGQKFYLPYFAQCRSVLDIGCGRGEFLEMMRDANVPARGIDLSEESVALCRHKQLDAEVADLYEYLQALPEAALDGIFCSQVVEHLPPERLPEMVKLAASRLSRGGVIAIETPNPECLAIFATHFYLDPTHTRPVPHPLLAFYLEEFGVGNIEVRRLAPARESMPSLELLPERFRDAFFGSLDYAILGRKL